MYIALWNNARGTWQIPLPRDLSSHVQSLKLTMSIIASRSWLIINCQNCPQFTVASHENIYTVSMKVFLTWYIYISKSISCTSLAWYTSVIKTLHCFFAICTGDLSMMFLDEDQLDIWFFHEIAKWPISQKIDFSDKKHILVSR